MGKRDGPPFIQLYGMRWPPLMHEVEIERECIRLGGQWKKSNGKLAGNGLFFHHKRLQQLLHPEKVWHRWNDLLLKNFIEHRIIGVIGPASSGKTREAADFARMSYYCWPECTTIIVSSTELETLEDRVWGEIKAQHKLARKRYDGIPGHLIESRRRLVTDMRQVEDGEGDDEGRDFRNGMVGVPCKKGGSYQGLGVFSGRKNKYVILVCDESSHMPRAYVDALSNLNKNTNFKAIVLGNPKDTTDALGIICEPSAELGGWDGGIDQNPGTKVWDIRWPNGVCVQLPGSDSPNLDGKLGIPLITQEQINADIAFYGKDSLQFSMMDEGRMPRGQGLRRVITRQMCLKFHAMEEPVWKSEQRTKIAFLDAAYGSVGGDRTVLGYLEFGPGLDKSGEVVTLLALVETMLVPVTAKEKDPNFDIPEEQIAKFVMDKCAAWNIPPTHFFFDTTGRGSLMAAFARVWSPQIQGIEFGGKPTERQVTNEIDVSCREYYSKRVTELWFNVSYTIQSGQFRGMTEEMMQEGSMREWGFVGGNKIEVEPKDKMKLKSGRSPDLFDALVCGLEGARHYGFVIKRAVGTAKSFNDGWKQMIRDRHQRFKERRQLNYRA
jgi:hypothetical protein